MGQSGCLGCDTFKDVVHEGIHDGHGFAADTSVWVYLLKYLVDVNEVGFLSSLLTFLVGITNGLGLTLAAFLAPLLAGFGGIAR